VFNVPLLYHKKIVDSIRAFDCQPLCTVADIADGVIQLRCLIDTYRNSVGLVALEEEIDRTWTSLLRQVQALRREDNSDVQATSRAMELILHFSWRPQAAATLAVLASELKEALCRLPARPCLLMDLTSCQLMLGAVAAAEHTQTKAYFVARQRRAVSSLRSRGWTDPLAILENRLVSDDECVSRFKVLWKDLDVQNLDALMSVPFEGDWN
jgi:hypothetical protein